MALAYAIEETLFEEDAKKILTLTNLSLKMFSTSFHKTVTFLEASDIEQIKQSLINYKNNSEKVAQFKNSLIEDLTAFQSEITLNYNTRLAELKKEKAQLEKNIKVLEFAKSKLVRERLAKVAWPYDAKTSEYDAMIARFEIKVKKLEQKIEDVVKLRPAATEVDILKYQHHLKEAFLAE